MGRLADKVCLITGGARGQGAAEGALFSAEGAAVWLADVLDEQGSATAGTIGCEYRHLDVRQEEEWLSLVDEITTVSGQIDVLINNAGIFRANKLIDTPKEEFELVMDINCTGVFLGLKVVGRHMREQGSGSIINISSVAGMTGTPGAIAYGASKWAVRGMTKTAAVELARHGVRVNSIHPGVIETDMLDDIPRGTEQLIKGTPMGRAADAREVANLALFLASEESSYSTGSEFQIDGGLHAV